MKKKERDWIKKATAGGPGAFKSKAKSAGMSTFAYARKVGKEDEASTKTKRQASLALTLQKMQAKRKQRGKRKT